LIGDCRLPRVTERSNWIVVRGVTRPNGGA
jgi:hypothetical protein